MILRFLITGIMVMAFPLSASSAANKMAARVAVLPFEVYSGEGTEYLGNTIARELSSRIATEGQITVVDQATIESAMGGEAAPNFNEDVLRRISEKLGAHFLVLGSLTRISRNLSLDVYIFNPSGTPPFSKDFTEGTELNTLIREMAGEIRTKVSLIASALPELQKSELIEEVKLALDVQPSTSTTVQIGEEGETVGQVLPEGQVREEILVEQMPEVEEEKEEGKEVIVSALSKTDLKQVVKQPDDVVKKESKKKSTPSPFSSNIPIKITSDNLEADNKRNEVIFKGNVVAKQGDMVIFSDKMRVKYETKGGIRRIEALGNVKMKQEDRIATGEKIVFYNAEQKIVMTGSPRIWQDDNLISCDKVTVLLKENRILFEGNVDSTLYPESVKESKQEGSKQVEAIASPSKPGEKKKTAEGKEESAVGEKVSVKGVGNAEKETIQKFISNWKYYWENKELENYMGCYSREFTSKGMNWHQWKTYKKRLNNRYHQISLSFNELRIVLEYNQTIVSFEQHYQADNYSDYGMKSLILKMENGDWKIFAEQWDPL
jgi:lipopolysaccharide export system protein LptA